MNSIDGRNKSRDPSVDYSKPISGNNRITKINNCSIKSFNMPQYEKVELTSNYGN